MAAVQGPSSSMTVAHHSAPTSNRSPELLNVDCEADDHDSTPRGMRVVCISDTHGMHRSLTVPSGDVLLHGGDFTRYGKIDDALDFNVWLGTLEHRHKFVVLGNHEANAEWSERVVSILSNAVVLDNSGAAVCRADADGSCPLRIWGTAFYWPVETPHFVPPFAGIPDETDLIVCHGPAAGYVDGGSGCRYLLQHVARVRPMAVVCGHIHQAHGITRGREADGVDGTLFINAANAGGHGAKEHSRALGWPPMVLDVPLKREPFSGESDWDGGGRVVSH